VGIAKTSQRKSLAPGNWPTPQDTVNSGPKHEGSNDDLSNLNNIRSREGQRVFRSPSFDFESQA